MLGTFTNQ